MMAVANDKPMPGRRDLVAWCAVGALSYLLAVWGASWFVEGKGPGEIFGAIVRSARLAAVLGLGLILSTAVIGFSSRKRAFTLRAMRNFVIQNLVAIAALLAVVWGFGGLARADGIGASEWAAAVAGATLIAIAALGTFATASVHAGADLVDDEMAAEDMRERGTLILCSLAWIAACGLLLIVLALAGPGGMLTPVAVVPGVLVLIGVLAVLGIAAWRLSDELGRTLSHETGNMAFYLIWVIGSGWAMLAHLGFASAPAPLDWVTLFTLALFAASFIVMGRRKLLRA